MVEEPPKTTFLRACLELGLLAILFAPLGYFQARFFYYFFGYTPLALGLLPLPALAIGRLRRRYGWYVVLLIAFAGVMLGHTIDPWKAPPIPAEDFGPDWSVVGSVGHAPLTVNGFDAVASREMGEPVWRFVTNPEPPQKYPAVLYRTNFAEFRFAVDGTRVIDMRVEFESDFGIPIPDWEDPPITDGELVGMTVEQALEFIKLGTDGEWDEPIQGEAWILTGEQGKFVSYQHDVLACYGECLYLGNNRALALGDESKGSWDRLLYKHFSHAKGRYVVRNGELANSRDLPEGRGSETAVQLREDRVVKIWAKFPLGDKEG
jgi:hypothetical protein